MGGGGGGGGGEGGDLVLKNTIYKLINFDYFCQWVIMRGKEIMRIRKQKFYMVGPILSFHH